MSGGGTGARKTVTIVQSSYIPWRGYFDLIRAADHFVLLDNVQFTRRDWRSRNRIKTANGPAWLSVPVYSKARRTQRISETMVTDVRWARRHWRSLQYAYGKAPFFGDYRESLAAAYEEVAALDHLSAINNHFIRLLCSILSIRTPISFSHDILPVETLDALDSSTRLAALCEALKGDCYLSGPSARDYLRIAPFEERGIEARFAVYHGYPNYAQPHGTYDPFVTVLDLIFCTGPRAPSHLIDLKASSVAAE